VGKKIHNSPNCHLEEEEVLCVAAVWAALLPATTKGYSLRLKKVLNGKFS
jgi:hypothetical protein